ncbi:hypothetical protein AB0M86_19710 [Streptomyces sp. NPDC051639]|uniref:hypothetical protein n=1 Tax=unclassified Streptomyces TaxID=2593676 RepID=UPI002E301195|nr:hypothetical protein [Streptomyces sp. NBC_01455]
MPAGTRTAESESDAGTDAEVTTTDAEVTTTDAEVTTGADATADAGGTAEPVAEEATGSSESENAGERGRKAEAAHAATGATPSEDVEIPQQQTAEKAADNGAGEGARK